MGNVCFGPPKNENLRQCEFLKILSVQPLPPIKDTIWYLILFSHLHQTIFQLLCNIKYMSVGTWFNHSMLELKPINCLKKSDLNSRNSKVKIKLPINSPHQYILLNIQPVVIVRGLKRQQADALTNFVGCFLLALFYFFFLFCLRWMTLLVPVLGLLPEQHIPIPPSIHGQSISIFLNKFLCNYELMARKKIHSGGVGGTEG